ncbi:hypothetical protein ACFLWR_04905 [Chloroflexota bacterium]
MMGQLQGWIAEKLGFFIAWILPFIIVFGCIWLGYYIRSKKVKAPKNDVNNNNYVDKIIVDSKVPAVLEITDTLQKMADYQDTCLNKLLNKKIKRPKLLKIRKSLQARLNMDVKDSKLGNSVKIDIIQKEMKKLGMYTKDFKEGIVPFLVEVTWVLDSYDAGMPQYLENEEYTSLYTLLNEQTKNITGDVLEEMILIYEDICLGFNSMIAHINYFPKAEQLKAISQDLHKSTKQLKHERDQILKTYLQQISKEIAIELKRK